MHQRINNQQYLDKEADYTFVIGCPRSGTTLLRSIFQNHPQIAVSPELRFFFQVVSRWRRFQPLTKPEKQKQLTDYIFHKLQKFKRIDDYRDIVQDPAKPEEIFELKKKEFAKIFQGGVALSEKTVFEQLLRLFSDKQGSHYLVKTPANRYMLPQITRLLPQARIVHMVRDGRDIATSLMKGKRQWVADLQTAVLIWSNAVRIGRRYEQKLGQKRFYRVHFEDLITDPEATLKSLCWFMGVDYDKRLLEVISVNSSFNTGDSGFQHSSIGRHSQLLSSEELAICERLAGPELALMGYKSNGSYSVWKKLTAFGRRYFFFSKEALKIFFRNRQRYHWVQRFFY